MILNSDRKLIKNINFEKSQKKFIEYLNSDIINKLVQLFDKTSKTNNSKKIINYINDERRAHGLTESDLTYESDVYLREGDPILDPCGF
jgi:hypothetical protein